MATKQRPSISDEPFLLESNAARSDCPAPLLSVLVPFYETSPMQLLESLARQAAGRHDVELIFGDDGSGDARHGRTVGEAMSRSAVPTALLTARRNVGRAAIRNALARTARGTYLLFVDCDLQPGSAEFLERWLALARPGDSDVGYGGFQMRPCDDGTSLHAYYSARSDCLPAEERQRDPAKYTYTNNLLVSRKAVLSEPFDERFKGWGWEDVEWALRAAQRWTIKHIDNPVLNPADGSARTLLRKFRESVGNFALLRRLHPAEVEKFPIFRASRILALVPMLSLMLPVLEIVAIDTHELFPMQLRYLALKLYRACLYGAAYDVDEA